MMHVFFIFIYFQIYQYWAILLIQHFHYIIYQSSSEHEWFIKTIKKFIVIKRSCQCHYNAENVCLHKLWECLLKLYQIDFALFFFSSFRFDNAWIYHKHPTGAIYFACDGRKKIEREKKEITSRGFKKTVTNLTEEKTL